MKILTFSKLTKTRRVKWTGKRDVQLKVTKYEKMKIIGNLWLLEVTKREEKNNFKNQIMLKMA